VWFARWFAGIAAFIRTLRQAGIELVLDIRAAPVSPAGIADGADRLGLHGMWLYHIRPCARCLTWRGFKTAMPRARLGMAKWAAARRG
jgi:hypothetical protein